MLMIAGPVTVRPSAKADAARKAVDRAEPAGDAVAAPGRAPDARAAPRRDPEPSPPRVEARPKVDDAPVEPWRGRAFAPLVAQLIATRLGLAQTRARRRGALREAAAAYRRAAPALRDNPVEIEA